MKGSEWYSRLLVEELVGMAVNRSWASLTGDVDKWEEDWSVVEGCLAVIEGRHSTSPSPPQEDSQDAESQRCGVAGEDSQDAEGQRIAMIIPYKSQANLGTEN